jgi:hypothetical protein
MADLGEPEELIENLRLVSMIGHYLLVQMESSAGHQIRQVINRLPRPEDAMKLLAIVGTERNRHDYSYFAKRWGTGRFPHAWRVPNDYEDVTIEIADALVGVEGLGKPQIYMKPHYGSGRLKRLRNSLCSVRF